MNTLIHKHVRHTAEEDTNRFARCIDSTLRCYVPCCPQHQPENYAEYMAAHSTDTIDIEGYIASERCPACGEYLDYCYGHGEMGDPINYRILVLHRRGNHSACHPHSECKR